MADTNGKATLHRYLQAARAAVVWKLDGLSEYHVRRPMVATGTNLLGLVKHLTAIEIGYFGITFDRPFDATPPWYALMEANPNIELYAAADESRDEIVELYQRACAHDDGTIMALDLDGAGAVPWWPPERRAVTLQQILVHVIAETNRHAGHADIVRELIDGTVGMSPRYDNMAPGDEAWWASYRRRLEALAEQFRDDPS